MGCNLSCHWTAPGGLVSRCDESQTWDASRFDLRAQSERWEVEAIVKQVEQTGAPMVIITGGEPMLHQDQPGFVELLLGVHRMGQRVEMETNGTIAPDLDTLALVDQFNVSPKLSSSGMDPAKAIRGDVLRGFADGSGSVFKFVVTGPADLAEVKALEDRLSIPRWRVWIMPAGDTADLMVATARDIAPAVAAAGYNFTLRCHLLTWPGKGEPRG